MKFTDLPLAQDILKGIEKAGFEECTLVQEKTFSKVFAGKDVAVQSQTGTGKTAAFMISIFHLFLEDKERHKKALILAPTRELALQIEEEAKLLGSFLPFITGCFYGGVGYHLQENLLSKGVDIIIGTPGRLLDYISSGKLSLEEIGIVVIDEADRMFDMGFLPDLKRILSRLPGKEYRRTMLFSATLSSKVKALAWEYMHDAEEIEISPEKITVEEITQELYHVSKEDKFSLLLGVLDKEKPDNLIIFTNTKRKAEEVAKRLEFNGRPCTYIIGDMPQKKRTAVINGIKQGKISTLVATDVAARGLHIDDLSMVINYDLPEDYENYVHRIGRTARAGKRGKAVSLACEQYVFSLPAIEKFINMKIPVLWPASDLYLEDKSRGVPITRELRQSRKAKQQGRGRKSVPYHSRKPMTRVSKPASVRPPEPREKKEFKQIPKTQKPPRPQKKSINISNQGSIEARLEYYKKKYGENFNLASTESVKPEKKEGFFDKIKKALGRKRNKE